MMSFTEHLIEYIKIFNLHGERDVTLTMKNGVKILVGDNGSGKTTVLHCLYSILSCDFYKLLKIEFDKIEIKFPSGDIVEFTSDNEFDKNQLELFSDMGFSEPKSMAEIYHFGKLREFVSTTERLSLGAIRRHASSIRLMEGGKYTTRDISEFARAVSRDARTSDYPQNDKKVEIIKKNFPYRVYYLPTYRRIEEDFKNLGYELQELDGKDQLIQFGMVDVKRRFDGIKSQLKESAVSLYTNLNGKMLTQLTMGFQAKNEEFKKISNTDALKIVLARVGDSISEGLKNRIFELVDSKEIRSDRYHPLVFVLSNLIDVYDQQKDMDDAIKEFVNVANRYLVDKEFSYDENKVEINIVNKRTRNFVSLDKLSSGEKQLISILSKLYLEETEKYAVIFDEPELSLSIEWQETLLPDILNSKKCSFLLAATHSPFIFNNELDLFTGSLDVDFREDIND